MSKISGIILSEREIIMYITGNLIKFVAKD